MEEFLSSLRASVASGLRVYIADNGSSDVDKTMSIAHSAGTNARVVPLGSNFGYGGAINQLVPLLPADVRYLLISNPDVQFQPGAIATMRAAFDDLHDIAAIGPRILNRDGSAYPSARNLPSLRTGIGHALFVTVWPGNPWSRRYRIEAEPSLAEREAEWLSGACLLVRRDLFERIGGFDEDFFMYFEDVDLGRRLGEDGWKNWYLPAAEVIHTGGQSTSREAPRMIVAHHQSAYRYLAKRYSGAKYLPLRLVLRLALGARARWNAQRHRRGGGRDTG